MILWPHDLGVEVARDRPSRRTPTLRQRGAPYRCLNEHFPNWQSKSLASLETFPMQPGNTPLSHLDKDLLLLPLAPADITTYQSEVGRLSCLPLLPSTLCIPPAALLRPLRAQLNCV